MEGEDSNQDAIERAGQQNGDEMEPSMVGGRRLNGTERSGVSHLLETAEKERKV